MTNKLACFYASNFRCRRHYVFMFSVHPSLRPSVCWSIQLTIAQVIEQLIDFPPIQPAGWCEMYRGIFLENAWKKLPEIWHAEVSWAHSELLKFWSWSINLPIFYKYFWLNEIKQMLCLQLSFWQWLWGIATIMAWRLRPEKIKDLFHYLYVIVDLNKSYKSEDAWPISLLCCELS